MSNLKNRTLKNHYERRSLTESTLVEAIDLKKVEAASNAIAKLEALIPPNANMLRKAIEAAKTDLQKAANGGLVQGIKSAFGGDPLLKTSAMINALQTGFAALPKVLGMYLPQEARQEGQRSTFELIPPEKQQQFIDTMTKAFAPTSTGSLTGDVKAMFSNNVMPYVNNLNAAIKELMMNVAPNGAFKLGQQAAAAPKPEIVKATPEPASQAAATAPTTGSEPTQSSTAAATTQATAPTQAAKAPTPQKKLNPKTDSDRIANISYFLASQTGVDKAAAQKLIAKLAELNGLTDIPTPQKPSNKLSAGAVPGGDQT